jgi:protocatechuate 3,4-dioxygenase beta subunit
MTKLNGRVTDENANPVADAVVEIRNSAGDIVDSVQVDSQGNYTYHLSSGSWTLNVWDPHGRRGRAEVELIDGGDDHKADITIEPEGAGSK